MNIQPDHICHWAVRCERSNYTTFKNLSDILAVLKAAFTVCVMKVFWGKRFVLKLQ